MQNVDQTMNRQKTLLTSPSWVSYGVSIVSILKKIIELKKFPWQFVSLVTWLVVSGWIAPLSCGWWVYFTVLFTDFLWCITAVGDGCDSWTFIAENRQQIIAPGHKKMCKYTRDSPGLRSNARARNDKRQEKILIYQRGPLRLTVLRHRLSFTDNW